MSYIQPIVFVSQGGVSFGEDDPDDDSDDEE